MIEKFNKKYSALNKTQTELLERKLSGDDDGVKNLVRYIKRQANQSIENFYNSCDNQVLSNKRSLVEGRIESLEVNTTDETITKALMLSNLIEEMENGDE